MSSFSSPKPSRVKVSEHRARLRAQGLRPIQIWVPDVRAPSFKTEAHHQSLAVATSTHAPDDQAFIDAVSAIDFEEGSDAGGAATSRPFLAARIMRASPAPLSSFRRSLSTPLIQSPSAPSPRTRPTRPCFVWLWSRMSEMACVLRPD